MRILYGVTGEGRTTPRPDVDAFRAFLRALPQPRRLESGNALAFSTLDRVLDQVVDQPWEE